MVGTPMIGILAAMGPTLHIRRGAAGESAWSRGPVRLAALERRERGISFLWA